MKRLLFVCHGNICRSTMAQSVMAHLAQEAGAADSLTVDSAATSTEEIGNPPHPGTRRALERHGVPLLPHRARRVRADEYGDWDLIVYMDRENRRGLLRIFGGDPEGKVVPLLSFADPRRAAGRDEVADPWYTGDFEATYRDVAEGCRGLLDAVLSRRPPL